MTTTKKATIWYEGHRASVGETTVRRSIDPRNDVRNHSPAGFEWGYGGSGPAQLALALCADVLDGNVLRAQRVYQEVKWRLVAYWDQDNWTVSRDVLLELIENIERNLRSEGNLIEIETCAKHGHMHFATDVCPACIDEEDQRIEDATRLDIEDDRV